MAANKRITIVVNDDIDVIRDELLKRTGIKMSYVQIINYLIHFYMTKANEPATQWKGLK